MDMSREKSKSNIFQMCFTLFTIPLKNSININIKAFI